MEDENALVNAVSEAIAPFLRDPDEIDDAVLAVIEAVNAALDAPPTEEELQHARKEVTRDLVKMLWPGLSLPS